jgi:hypothetical protein
LSVRVETANGQSAEKPITVNKLVNSDDAVVYPDFDTLPGFDDDEGIARRLVIRRGE